MDKRFSLDLPDAQAAQAMAVVNQFLIKERGYALSQADIATALIKDGKIEVSEVTSLPGSVVGDIHILWKKLQEAGLAPKNGADPTKVTLTDPGNITPERNFRITFGIRTEFLRSRKFWVIVGVAVLAVAVVLGLALTLLSAARRIAESDVPSSPALIFVFWLFLTIATGVGVTITGLAWRSRQRKRQLPNSPLLMRLLAGAFVLLLIATLWYHSKNEAVVDGWFQVVLSTAKPAAGSPQKQIQDALGESQRMIEALLVQQKNQDLEKAAVENQLKGFQESQRRSIERHQQVVQLGNKLAAARLVLEGKRREIRETEARLQQLDQADGQAEQLLRQLLHKVEQLNESSAKQLESLIQQQSTRQQLAPVSSAEPAKSGTMGTADSIRVDIQASGPAGTSKPKEERREEKQSKGVILPWSGK